MSNPPACQSALERELAILRGEHRAFWDFIEATSLNLGLRTGIGSDERLSKARESFSRASQYNPQIVFDIERPYFLSAYLPVADALASIGVDTVCVVNTPSDLADCREISAARHLQVPFVCCEQISDVDERRLVILGNPHRTVSYPNFSRRALFSHGGCPVGGAWLGRVLESGITHYLALGPGDRELGERLSPGIWDACEYVPVGWPKLDTVTKSRPREPREISSMGLDPNLPTILMCSHWSAHGLLRSIGPSVIATLWELSDYNILVTAHPSITHIPHLPFKLPLEVLFAGVPLRPNLRFLSTCDSTQVLHLADVIVSDLSSISVEAACLGIPVMMFRRPDHTYSNENLYRKLLPATYPFEKPDELPNLVRTILTGNGTEKCSEVEALSHYSYYNLGSATQRAAKAIAALL